MEAQQARPEATVTAAVSVREVLPLQAPAVVLSAFTTVPTGSTMPAWT